MSDQLRCGCATWEVSSAMSTCRRISQRISPLRTSFRRTRGRPLAPEPVLGLDVACTKIAVDFQNMRQRSVDECMRRNLELLREVTGSDCAFLAAFNPDELIVKDVQLARSAFAQCRPEGAARARHRQLPWLKARLDHLRLSELRDTSAPRREQAAEASASRSSDRVRYCWSPCVCRASRRAFGPCAYACRAAPGT